MIFFFLEVEKRSLKIQEGRSKNKVFKEAYSEAIQEAMQTMALISHNYQGSEQTVEEAVVTESPDRIEATPEAEANVSLAEPVVVPVMAEEASEPLAKEESVPELTYWEETASNNGYILTHPEKEVTWVIMKNFIP